MPVLQRVVVSEWLDRLPAEDQRALASRRDLRLLNLLMGHAAIFEKALGARWQHAAPASMLDLGTGDGFFTLSLAQRLRTRWPQVEITLLDRQPPRENVIARFAGLGWRAEAVQEDVFSYLSRARNPTFDIVLANLFLHHFRAPELVSLLGGIAKVARRFVAVEPRRNRFSLLASRSLWALGACEVTRHDARASARAGFSGQELSELWPQGAEWERHEGPAGLFSHCFAARRRE